jgi:EAL domain-containing protein (putative c-di-GMP-specific phosphodiesterase class I)/glycosyltransferase involved in cell wall biosynthesis/DNA-binding NarL/FixJ family response regulator
MLLAALMQGIFSFITDNQERLISLKGQTEKKNAESPNSCSVGRQIKVSIITQFYPPDFAATGQFVEELATQLVTQQLAVQVFTGQPGYAFETSSAPEYEISQGVEIRRSRLLRTRSRKMLGRTVSSLAFCWHAFWYLLNRKNWGDILLFTSEPPYLQTLGYLLNKFFGVPFACIVYDLYPDVAVELKVLPKNHGITRFWDLLNRRVWRRAEAIIVPCQTMKDRIVAKVPKIAEKISVVHNWADPTWIKPLDKCHNAFAQTHQLVHKFTVLYSGNMGRCHDMETILGAAQELQSEPVQFLFIGGGPKREACQQKVQQKGLTNCLFLPYQDKSLLPQSLTACDLSLVSVDIGMEGLVAPSKFYSALASGRPVAVICEKHSYLRQLVAEANCGVALSNGDSKGLADFIRYLASNPKMANSLGLSGHRYIQDCFTPEIVSKQYGRLLYEAVVQHVDLRQAVHSLLGFPNTPSEFLVHYQPVVAFGTQKISSVEALLRWQHPERGIMTTDTFITAAETTGLMIPLGWWVLRICCQQLANWKHQFPDKRNLKISVNLSSQEFFQAEFVSKLDTLLMEHDLSGEALILEIKDEVAMEDPAATTAILLQLRARRIQICIDNFGASHSSLGYLHRFPVDYLKIDASLVRRLDIDPDSINLIETIGILAQDLGMVAIATGIETSEQLQRMTEVGLAYGQGHIFSPSVDSEQILQLLQQEQSALINHPMQVQRFEQLYQQQRSHVPTVLIMDDDRFMRTLLTAALEQEGYQVLTAATGREGLQTYQRHQPDLVIVDIKMPDMDGLTCCRQLRMLSINSQLSSPRAQLSTSPMQPDRVPILVITGLDEATSAEAAFAAGATDYLNKPVNWTVLRQRLRHYLTEVMRYRVQQFFKDRPFLHSPLTPRGE